MTRIEQLILHPRLKEELLKRLKQRRACGGALDNGALVLQGDHRDFVEAELRDLGYEVRRHGG